jgi:ketosteroid isomerase-like protein
MNHITKLTIALLVVITAVSYAAVAEKTTRQAKATGRNDKITAAVRAVLDAQRDAWNRGDIAGYMDGYARSADITFVSGNSITRGWQTVHDRYQKNYDSREKMGTLTFSDLETTILSTDTAMVLGSWHLQRANDQPHGRFTLILRSTKQGWRIIHDHTSSAS